MYFPIGWPRQLRPLNAEENWLQISSNRERIFLGLLSARHFSIWYCKPAVQIILYTRDSESVQEYGENELFIWKPDSSMVAICTSKGYILFFKISLDKTKHPCAVYTTFEHRKHLQETSVEDEHIPALVVSPSGSIQIPGNVKCIECIKDELMICTGYSLLQRLRWDGLLNGEFTVTLAHVPFSTDLENSGAAQLSDPDLYITHLKYDSLLHGFLIVLSNGKAAYLTSSSVKFDSGQMQAVWAPDLHDAVSCGVNHKYLLMAFGCENGEGIVYCLDEMTGALQISSKLVVPTRDFPDARHVCGSAEMLKWTPDGRVLIMTWQHGGFGLWSVFGSLLLCSLTFDHSSNQKLFTNPNSRITSLEWSCEGYHLWIINDDEQTTNESGKKNLSLQVLSFVKSSSNSNCGTTNQGQILLQGEDRLYLSVDEFSTKNWHSQVEHGELISAFGGRHWTVLPIPEAYLTHNFPIRYSAVDSNGTCVAVAGKTGLAHFALNSRRWKLFGNENQEREVVVSGGLTWWKEFICAACFNIPEQRDEIRFYTRETKLDNTFSEIVKIPFQLLLLNTFKDLLVVLCLDAHIMLLKMERKKNKGSYASVVTTKIQEIPIGNFVPQPLLVTWVTMTPFRTETASVKIPQQTEFEAESILLNVAGKLLMFQRDRSGMQLKSQTDNKPLPFCAPVMVASSVENMWSMCATNSKKDTRYICDALWLGCGAFGIKVWLPLPHSEDSKAHSFMSKRIMLPIKVDLYPLAILFEAGVILGTISDAVTYKTSGDQFHDSWPYLALERTSQIFLHHVLRQLLRRNLGVHALQLAFSYQNLPYFPHVLELLLHEVLEEEATSKDPTPDPLLPRVVAFIQEFPEFHHETIVHCARKTEVALWPHLFAVVGNPKDLFEDCLLNKKLQTASSYLIILQNLEKPMVSRQHATLLLDAALESCEWELARDLVRFLKAIDPSEAESPHSPRTREGGSFIFNPSIRAKSDAERKDKKEKVKHTVSCDNIKVPKKQANQTLSQKSEELNSEKLFIDVILNRHARHLLSSYRLFDLACFAANLDDYQLIGWLKREKLRAARVDDFITAINKLHQDFGWPLPLPPLTSINLSRLSLDSLSSISTPTSSAPSTVIKDETTLKHPDKLDIPIKRNDMSPGSPHSANIRLLPQKSQECSSYANTEISEISDLDGTQDVLTYSDIDSNLLHNLSQQLANKGPPESEHQLRFLLQVVQEAGCLEWALILSILLRDITAVVRTVNLASLPDTTTDIILRMRNGLQKLEEWSQDNCPGYKAVCTAIQNQILRLNGMLISKERPRTRNSSSNSQMSLPSPTTPTENITKPFERDCSTEESEEKETEPEEDTENQSRDCVIS